MDKINKLFTIGQFAQLHGVNKKTLMWYDEIGLFHPAAVDPNNGYRLYSCRQSSALETILLLRELDMPLDEIRAALSKRREDMRTLMELDLSRIELVDREVRPLITVDVDQSTPFDKQVELIVAETRKHQLRSLHDAACGTMISVDSLIRGDVQNYSKLFIEIPSSSGQAGLHLRPGGYWAQAFYQGPWEELPRHYRKAFDFIRAQHMESYGWAHEMIVNESVAEGEEDSIVRIEVPVRPMRQV